MARATESLFLPITKRHSRFRHVIISWRDSWTLDFVENSIRARDLDSKHKIENSYHNSSIMSSATTKNEDVSSRDTATHQSTTQGPPWEVPI